MFTQYKWAAIGSFYFVTHIGRHFEPKRMQVKSIYLELFSARRWIRTTVLVKAVSGGQNASITWTLNCQATERKQTNVLVKCLCGRQNSSETFTLYSQATENTFQVENEFGFKTWHLEHFESIILSQYML